MLSILLLGMTFTMLWGARGLVGNDGDDPVEVLAAEADDSPEGVNTTTTTVPVTTAPTTAPTTIPAETTTTAPTTTAAVVHPPNEVITRVGNGAERGGVAGAGTNVLVAAGYATLSPKNAETIDVSTVYFLPGYSKDAELVAQLLNVAPTNIFPMPDNPGMPVGDAQVIAVLGRDTAYGN